VGWTRLRQCPLIEHNCLIRIGAAHQVGLKDGGCQGLGLSKKAAPRAIELLPRSVSVSLLLQEQANQELGLGRGCWNRTFAIGERLELLDGRSRIGWSDCWRGGRRLLQCLQQNASSQNHSLRVCRRSGL